MELYICSSLTGKVELLRPSPVQSGVGFVGSGGPGELCDTFLSAVCWHLCLLGSYRCTDRGNVGQSQGREAPALLKPELGLHTPDLRCGAAARLEQAGRVTHLPQASVVVAIPSHQPARTRMGRTPSGSWCWMIFDDFQHRYLSLFLQLHDSLILENLIYNHLEVRMDTKSIWGENIRPRLKQKASERYPSMSRVFFAVKMVFFFYNKFYDFKNKSKIKCFYKDSDYVDVEDLILHNPVVFYKLDPCSDYTSYECSRISPTMGWSHGATEHIGFKARLVKWFH